MNKLYGIKQISSCLMLTVSKKNNTKAKQKVKEF